MCPQAIKTPLTSTPQPGLRFLAGQIYVRSPNLCTRMHAINGHMSNGTHLDIAAMQAGGEQLVHSALGHVSHHRHRLSVIQALKTGFACDVLGPANKGVRGGLCRPKKVTYSQAHMKRHLLMNWSKLELLELARLCPLHYRQGS
jgi:hypothetical protein